MKQHVKSISEHSKLVTDPIPRGWGEAFQPGLITIVIPTYNHERFLVDAVKSALAQTYPLIEIIVVDDGSTDNTPVVMAPYTDQVTYIRQANRGLSGARNTGILAARGEFIALLDADDYWERCYLRTTHTALTVDSGLAAVHTGMHFVDAQGTVQAQPGIATVPDDQMYDRLLDGEFFAPSAVLVRRWAFAAVGLFDLELRASEDWEMWLRVARSYRFGGIAEPLLNYRVHGSNMSGDPDHMLHYQRLTLQKHFGEFGETPERWDPKLQRAYAAVAYYAAQGNYLRGDQEQGTRYLREALEANPALTESLDIFYELGCVDQPLGQRGDPATLNVKQNADRLFRSLEHVFAAPELSPRLSSKKRSTFAHAHRALGTLAYNAGKRREARYHLWHALCTKPTWARQKSFIGMLAKSMLNQQMFTTLRALRANATSS